MANIINAVWRKAVKDVKIKGEWNNFGGDCVQIWYCAELEMEVHFPDYLIPEGWGVMASFTSIHMDEENYENPYQFNPWRWEVSGTQRTIKSSYLLL